MFFRCQPSAASVAAFITGQQQLPFSYAAVGATQGRPPAGFTVDHKRIMIGAGPRTFARAVAALRAWQQFDLGWVTVRPRDLPLAVGTTVAVEVHKWSWWSLNAARIVYVVDEYRERQARFGFAYGTLPDHVERGEERFLVEWLADDSVWYDIFACSRPRHPAAWVGYPLTRRLQHRFVGDSLAAMSAAVTQS